MQQCSFVIYSEIMRCEVSKLTDMNSCCVQLFCLILLLGWQWEIWPSTCGQCVKMILRKLRNKICHTYWIYKMSKIKRKKILYKKKIRKKYLFYLNSCSQFLICFLTIEHVFLYNKSYHHHLTTREKTLTEERWNEKLAPFLIDSSISRLTSKCSLFASNVICRGTYFLGRGNILPLSGGKLQRRWFRGSRL